MLAIVLGHIFGGVASAQAAGAGPGTPGAESTGSVISPNANTSPLAGTLFFSDRERNRMDQLRNRPQNASQQADGETVEARSVINGYVKRGDGGVTVWVDGVPIERPGRQLAEKISASSVGISLADVRISVVENVKSGSAAPPPVARAVRKKAATKARTK